MAPPLWLGHRDPARVGVNIERVDHWKAQGAQLSPTVSRLVKQFGKKAA